VLLNKTIINNVPEERAWPEKTRRTVLLKKLIAKSRPPFFIKVSSGGLLNFEIF
jgi:hypothetical protein